MKSGEHNAQSLGFNEAGAKSAGKHAHVGSEDLPTGRFNEAGAKSAGKQDHHRRADSQGRGASMRPAQKAPENEAMRILICIAERELQ